MPTQALQLLNDDFVVGRADARLSDSANPTSDAQNVREAPPNSGMDPPQPSSGHPRRLCKMFSDCIRG